MSGLLQILEPGQHDGDIEKNNNEIAIGIDLGTTHSLIAFSRDETPEVLTIGSDKMIPSVVSYQGNEITVGQDAVEELQNPNSETISSIKRLMGKGYSEIASSAHSDRYPLVENIESGVIRLCVQEKHITPIQISAEILKKLKHSAEKHFDQDINKAVITVPAYFDEGARTATKDAAKLAGLEVLRLVNEPTAAALAYGLDKGVEGIYIVYDLGGGTFDLSLLKLEKGLFQVLATGGSTEIGGDDFDQVLYSALQERSAYSPHFKTYRRLLLEQIKHAKQALSTQDSYTFTLECKAFKESHTITREEFNTLAKPFVEETIQICHSVLEDAQIGLEDIQGVVLVGGSTRIPFVRQHVEQFFKKQPLVDLNPDEIVALGAALQAEALVHGSSNLLLDITPLSLGLETYGGLTEKIIHRHSPIPISKAQEFTTFKDDQQGMIIHVVQGERETVDECRSLAQFELSGIPPMVAGAARIRVTFTLDADGLLTVSAEEKTTGTKQKIEVQPSYGLKEEELEQMLRDSLEHAEEDIEKRLLTESKVGAKRLIETVESALETDHALLNDEEKQALFNQIASLNRSLKSDDREKILEMTSQLETSSQKFAELRMNTSVQKALSGKDINDISNQL